MTGVQLAVPDRAAIVTAIARLASLLADGPAADGTTMDGFHARTFGPEGAEQPARVVAFLRRQQREAQERAERGLGGPEHTRAGICRQCLAVLAAAGLAPDAADAPAAPPVGGTGAAAHDTGGGGPASRPARSAASAPAAVLPELTAHEWELLQRIRDD